MTHLVNVLFQPVNNAWEPFVRMLPAITRHARFAFCRLKGDNRDDLVQEVVANAAVAYMRLVELRKADLAYPTVLARYGVAQVRDGRRVGSRLRGGDVLAGYCRRKKGVIVERLDKCDPENGQWEEAIIEDRRAGPADVATCRIDFSEWLGSLPSFRQRIARMLATGESTTATARRFRISAGRISQLRREIAESWRLFQGSLPSQDAVNTPA